MSDQRDAEGQHPDGLPQLAAEEYVCHDCGMSYEAVSVENAAQVIRCIPSDVRDAVLAIPTEAWRLRPGFRAWSITEYVCHIRDVYATYTIRLHRARTEVHPFLEPMFNDLRAKRFRYNESDMNAVLFELSATAVGFCEEIDHTGPGDWDRLVARLPSEERTARWLVRQAMHEGKHHLADIRRTGEAVVTQA
jgi:DinB superfamily